MWQPGSRQNGQSPVEQRRHASCRMWADQLRPAVLVVLATLGECAEVLGFTREPNREKYRN